MGACYRFRTFHLSEVRHVESDYHAHCGAGVTRGLGVVPKTDAKPERFVQFKEADIAGNAGCNRFFGRYTFDGAAIKIGPLASTRMACPAEVMEAEQAWLRMLETARSAETSGKDLVLNDTAGFVIATLKRRDLD